MVPPRHKGKLGTCLNVGSDNPLHKAKLYNPKYDLSYGTSVSCREADCVKFFLMWKAKGQVGMGQHINHIFKNAQVCMEEMKKREGFHPILDRFEGTNICFVYVPLKYRSIIKNSKEYYQKMSRLCVALKRYLMFKGKLCLSYNELKNSKSAFLVLGLHNSAVTREDIVYVLDQIEIVGEPLVKK